MKKKFMKKIITTLCAACALSIPFSASAAGNPPTKTGGTTNTSSQNHPTHPSIINNPFENDDHSISVESDPIYEPCIKSYRLENPWEDEPGILMMKSDDEPVCPYATLELRVAYNKGFRDAKKHKNPAILENNASYEMQLAYNKGYIVTLANHDAIHNLGRKTFNDSYLQEIYDKTYKICVQTIGDLDGNNQKPARICTWEDVQDIYDNAYQDAPHKFDEAMQYYDMN